MALLLRGQLYGIESIDPATFVGVPVVLLVVSALAALVPARTAMRVDPVEALRDEYFLKMTFPSFDHVYYVTASGQHNRLRTSRSNSLPI